MTIWKYELITTDEQTVMMPEGADVLCVQVQHGAPCIWALVDPTHKNEPRKFVIHGTGQPVPETIGIYVGTYQLQGGAPVFHVFEAL